MRPSIAAEVEQLCKNQKTIKKNKLYLDSNTARRPPPGRLRSVRPHGHTTSPAHSKTHIAQGLVWSSSSFTDLNPLTVVVKKKTPLTAWPHLPALFNRDEQTKDRMEIESEIKPARTHRDASRIDERY